MKVERLEKEAEYHHATIQVLEERSVEIQAKARESERLSMSQRVIASESLDKEKMLSQKIRILTGTLDEAAKEKEALKQLLKEEKAKVEQLQRLYQSQFEIDD